MDIDEEQYMLTTLDNPFDPFTEFKEWLAYDTRAGHYTLSFLDRVVITSDSLSEAQQAYAIQQAIDEIVQYDVTGLYVKASRTNPVPGRRKSA